jgi:hypothetical protein
VVRTGRTFLATSTLANAPWGAEVALAAGWTVPRHIRWQIDEGYLIGREVTASDVPAGPALLAFRIISHFEAVADEDLRESDGGRCLDPDPLLRGAWFQRDHSRRPDCRKESPVTLPYALAPALPSWFVV